MSCTSEVILIILSCKRERVRLAYFLYYLCIYYKSKICHVDIHIVTLFIPVIYNLHVLKYLILISVVIVETHCYVSIHQKMLFTWNNYNNRTFRPYGSSLHVAAKTKQITHSVYVFIIYNQGVTFMNGIQLLVFNKILSYIANMLKLCIVCSCIKGITSAFVTLDAFVAPDAFIASYTFSTHAYTWLTTQYKYNLVRHLQGYYVPFDLINKNEIPQDWKFSWLKNFTDSCFSALCD